ncbi:MAG: nitroreductase family protein [bacterium]
MSWVTIDQHKCTACGMCVTRDPLVFREKDGRITTRANQDTCNLCGHCISLCPTGAISHSEMDMNNFIDLEGRGRFDTTDFRKLVRQRRSMRLFADRPVPRGEIETLIDICRYAPTGGNRQAVEIIVLADRDRINRYSNHVIDYFEQSIPVLEEKAERIKAEDEDIDQDTLSMLEILPSLERFVLARRHGFELVFHRAPVVMIFHSPRASVTPKDDCVIAAHTVVLAATTMGLGTCYIGLFVFAAATYATLMEELSLPQGNKVYSTLILGYPKFEYLRTTDRNTMKVRWE